MSARDRFIEVLRSRRMLLPGEEWVIDANLDDYRAEVLAKAIGRLRAVPVQCTALTGPVWYGAGWNDAITTLEEIADYQTPDDEKYPGELQRLRALELALRVAAIRKDSLTEVRRILVDHAEYEMDQREKSSRPAADATPATLHAEDARDLTTVAPAIHAAAQPCGDVIRLKLTATRDQWTAWQKALTVDLRRTTNRGNGLVTSHADWRSVHVVIACQLSEGAQ